MALKDVLVNALISKYEAQVAEARANITLFLENGVGVADHPGMLETIDTEVAKLEEAEGKLHSVKQFAAVIPPKVV